MTTRRNKNEDSIKKAAVNTTAQLVNALMKAGMQWFQIQRLIDDGFLATQVVKVCVQESVILDLKPPEDFTDNEQVKRFLQNCGLVNFIEVLNNKIRRDFDFRNLPGTGTWNQWYDSIPVDELEKIDASGVQLRGLVLSGMDLSICLKESNLQDAVMRDVYLEFADLRDCNMSGCNLSGITNICEANLGGCNLRGANLTSVLLRNANLWGAVIEDADLTDTSLDGANLEEAHVVSVNADPEQFAHTKNLDKAIEVPKDILENWFECNKK